MKYGKSFLQCDSHSTFHVPLEDFEGGAFEVGAEVVGLCKYAEDPYLIPIGSCEASVDVEGYLTMLVMVVTRDYCYSVDFCLGCVLILKSPIILIQFRTAEECQHRQDRKSTRLNSSHTDSSRMPSSA